MASEETSFFILGYFKEIIPGLESFVLSIWNALPQLWTLLSPSDIISLVGLCFTFLAWINAKSADKSAKEASANAQRLAKNYSDQLTLHDAERLTHLIKLLKTVTQKRTRREMCECIRLEIGNIQDKLYNISPVSERKLQEFMQFLNQYNGDEISKKRLEEHLRNFRDTIRELSITEKQSPKNTMVRYLKTYIEQIMKKPSKEKNNAKT